MAAGRKRRQPPRWRFKEDAGYHELAFNVMIHAVCAMPSGIGRSVDLRPFPAEVARQID